MLDCLIVGGGPAGLAVALTMKKAGLNFEVFEKGALADHIARYPPFMRFFSTNGNLEIEGFPLGITDEKPSRREYVKYLSDFVRYHQLPVRTWTAVTQLERRADGTFAVTTHREGREPVTIETATVVLAVGAWDDVRRLAVPGADLAKVHTRYEDTHPYIGQRVLVVGGRNSAVDTALQLWRAGAHVTLSYRRTEFNGVGLKYWLRPDIENRLKNGEIEGLLGSEVTRIDPESVTLRLSDGTQRVIGNDFVLPMLGYDPPVGFLRACGVELEPETNRPLHDPATLETTTPGLFVAGVITAGNVSGHVFIENSRHHGELIVPRVRELARGLLGSR